MDAAYFLAAYDEHLRAEAEMRGAMATVRMGPLWLARFPDSEVSQANADALVKRVTEDDQLELWAAEVGGEFVSAGRVELVPGTPFAGLWGGATRADWRGRGFYRAVTAARARSALQRGKTLVNSDSTEFSRPILERSGMVKVGTTTPYVWRR